MSDNNYLKKMGARIFSEANDLKRTIKSMAIELKVDYDYLQNVVDGKCNKEDVLKIIEKMGETYPIDSNDLILPEDDCDHGAIYFSAEQSKKTARVFNRMDKNKNKTPFYEYRDTAMSKLSPFKPEWIKQLRVVNNQDPLNPDAIYNRGHFMHQITFFIGCVNFYYEIEGKKYCKKMNTGDSTYITPYTPHTFTSRDSSQEAYIMAVTFGADARRSLKEIYALGVDRTKKYKLDIKNAKNAISQLIKQHMNNENITNDMLGFKINMKKILNHNIKYITKISKILNIEISDFMLPKYQKKQEVLTYKRKKQEVLLYPNSKNKIYKIINMARVSKMSNLKGFDIEVLRDSINEKDFFETSLHNYIYNYGEKDISIVWKFGDKILNKKLKLGDSIYIQPFINYGFTNIGNKNGKVCVVRVGGSINSCTQKELSYFNDIERMAGENQCWFKQ